MRSHAPDPAGPGSRPRPFFSCSWAISCAWSRRRTTRAGTARRARPTTSILAWRFAACSPPRPRATRQPSPLSPPLERRRVARGRKEEPGPVARPRPRRVPCQRRTATSSTRAPTACRWCRARRTGRMPCATMWSRSTPTWFPLTPPSSAPRRRRSSPRSPSCINLNRSRPSRCATSASTRTTIPAGSPSRACPTRRQQRSERAAVCRSLPAGLPGPRGRRSLLDTPAERQGAPPLFPLF
mmetsp:Transcript_89166/g.238039  ORF Transcript_89166/g.238039 Transcript_89166/m.238039 type:complete len:240 (-) Transcript_89166:78-797(-)